MDDTAKAAQKAAIISLVVRNELDHNTACDQLVALGYTEQEAGGFLLAALLANPQRGRDDDDDLLER